METRDLNILDSRLIAMRLELLRVYGASETPSKDKVVKESSGIDKRRRLIDFIEIATERPNFVVTAPMFCLRHMGIGYLKKRTDLPLYKQALIDVLRAEENASRPSIFSETRKEIIARLEIRS
jgi:hypothetical protein